MQAWLRPIRRTPLLGAYFEVWELHANSRSNRLFSIRSFRAFLLGALLAASAVLIISPRSAWSQAGFDRPGSDYLNFTVRTGDPAVCANRCDRDGRCRAWSFSYPSAAGGRALCWLKSAVPPRIENSCCVSGVNGSGVVEPRKGSKEFGIDRTGGDFHNFETAPSPNGESCEAACRADGKCRAWTYTRPGYAGTAARCYLKNRVTRPRQKPCCISGVVR